MPNHFSTIYGPKLKARLESMSKSWSYKLDPTHYQRLYINKVYQESFNTGPSVSASLSSLPPLNKSLINVSSNSNSERNASFAGSTVPQ